MGSAVRLRGVLIVVLALAMLAPAGARAGIPVPWIPGNAGVLWYQPGDPNYPIALPKQPPGEASGAWWLVRRIVADPHLPGVMHMGSFFNGLYASAAGGGWATLTPGCWLPPDPPDAVPADARGSYRYARRIAVAVTGLDACGIEGIAYDPVMPQRMYVSAYDVLSLRGTEPTLGDGGVYVSDNLGVTWRKLIGGFRGNGLAVARDGSGPATIVSGYIQQSNASVGTTPDGGSLSVSNDDGKSWRSVSLPASGCADTPTTSQRITATVAIDPADVHTILAGTNAGLYMSRDGGTTWSIVRVVCGGVWGLAFSSDGGTVFTGDANGVVSRAPTSTTQFTQIADLGTGKIQSLIVDNSDPRLLYASIWYGGALGVFQVAADGSVTLLDDSMLRDVVPLDQRWPAGVPKPFPLAFDDSRGAAAPSTFLTQLPGIDGPLYATTVFRGVFVRSD